MTVTDGRQLSSDDLLRLIKEKESALFQVEETIRQRDGHAGRANLLAAELQTTKDDLAAEKIAHLDTRSKVGALQDRATRLAELERKYDEAVSDLGRLRTDLGQLRTTVSTLEAELGTAKGSFKQADGARKTAEEKLAAFNKLAKALAARKVAEAVIATESKRLGA